MSSSPPNTPPYPQRALHPFVGLGVEPLNPYPNFPPNTYYPPLNLTQPVTTCDPDDRIPPPPGFIYQHELKSLSYAPNELPAPEIENNEEEPVESNVEKPKVSYTWVGACSSSCSLPGALLVGHDVDGTAVYAGRAYHMGDMIPAKVIPAKQVAYIAYNGEELVKDQFEVMVLDEQESSSCCLCFGSGMLVPATPQWVPCSDGLVAEGALVAGTTADGENLYFGRVHHAGAIIPGKVQTSHGCCYFPFDGQEISSPTYEVLVIP